MQRRRSLKPYLFNGKELDTETGLYYYGARYYDPRVSLWLNVDPLAEKYPNISPYTYVANNPIKFVDYDGRDFGIYIDLKRKTVTIKATYYTTESDLNSANQAIKIWNDASGKYNYTYRNAAGNKVSLKINFELTTSVIKPENGESRLKAFDRILSKDKSGEANSYRILSDSKVEEGTNGTTSEGKSIMVKTSRAYTETGAHEIGHSLGADHSNSGILTSSSEDMNRSNDITSTNVADIMRAIKSTPTEPTKTKVPSGGLGRGTIHIDNNNLQTEKDYKNFRNGNITENK